VSNCAGLKAAHRERFDRFNLFGFRSHFRLLLRRPIIISKLLPLADSCARAVVAILSSYSIFGFVYLWELSLGPPPGISMFGFYIVKGAYLLLGCIALIAIWGSIRQWRLRIVLPVALGPFLLLWFIFGGVRSPL
jgi:hypothetical protein